MPISKTMGKIIIHGKIVEVGGPTPMVKIEHPVGAPVSMTTTKDMAKFMEKYLYRQVIMHGSRYAQGPGSASVQADIYNVQIISEEEEDVEASVDFVGPEGTVYLLDVRPDMISTILHVENPVFKESECNFGPLSPEMMDFIRPTQGTWKYNNKDEDGN